MENEIVAMPGAQQGMMVSRPPAEVLDEARTAAKALMTVIAQKKKPVIINGEQYLEFEDWQTVARFYGITVKVVKTELLDLGGVKGYEATAEAIRNTDGMVISSADAMCLNDEEKWSTRAKYDYVNGVKVKVSDIPVPLFQLRSMAQTRACAKALRNILAWVVVLAGFKPTPAEEMTDGLSASTKPPVAMPQAATAPIPPKAEKAAPASYEQMPALISEPQAKRLYAIAIGSGYTGVEIKEFLHNNFGVETSKELLREFYDDVVRHFQVKKDVE